jgi:HupE / UreJ protein
MRRLLLFLICGSAYAHVVSMSSGELHVTGRAATYELRIPMYEVAHVSNPETALLEHVKFEGARRTSSSCRQEGDTYVCRADYEFDRPVPDKIEAECTLFQVTVPNHVHLLYAVQGSNSDQEVFDQTFRQAEVRFHPPSRAELIAKDAAAGIGRLFQSVSGLLFLAVLALAARNIREMGILTIAFLAGEWLARPLAPRIPMNFSPEFLEAVLALTVAYLAAEIVFLPDSQARWVVVPVLGVAHGLPFAAFPRPYLTAASITQALVLSVLWLAARKIPPAWRRPAAGVLLVAGIGWFARMLL